jgi:hypothetical protein
MKWEEVGDWLKDNAVLGASLVGSLITGNVPAAVAAGISLVSTATGTGDPSKALAALQADPSTVVKLQELAYQNEANIRQHLESIELARLGDIQAEHKETQLTIRSGDTAEWWFVQFTRPGQAWVSLIAGIFYVFAIENPDITVLMILLTLSWTYAGLRQLGKGIDSVGGTIARVKEIKK